MGGRLVTHAVNIALLGRLDKITDRARLVLLLMASIGRDGKQSNVEAGIYFGGWEMLTRALGYPEYTPAAKRAVARAISELTDAGLIEPIGDARPGKRQAYRVTLPDAFGDKAPGT